MKELQGFIIAILLSVLLFHITVTGITNSTDIVKLQNNQEKLKTEIKKLEKKITSLEQSIYKPIVKKGVPCNKSKK